MARSIQSPGVELREIDFTVRPATVEGTTVFVAGFADQGPIDEVLQPTNLAEFEQIYGAPTNAAEQYFYQTAKAVFNSPAKVLATRLPYGVERGEGFIGWKYSALAYPVKSWKYEAQGIIPRQAQSITVALEDLTSEPLSGNTFGTLAALSGLAIGIVSTGFSTGSAIQICFEIAGGTTVPLTGFLAGFPIVKKITLTPGPLMNSPGEVNNAIADLFAEETVLNQNFVYEAQLEPRRLAFTIQNIQQGRSYQSIGPVAQRGGGITVSDTRLTVSDIVLGSDDVPLGTGGGTEVSSLSSGNTYFFGKPTFIELSQEEYNAIITDNIDWSDNPTGIDANTPFTFNTLSKAGLVILNKSQTTVNNSFEGYYVGVIDNNNYNVATPFNGIRYVDSISNSTRGTNDFTRVPTSRLNFSLSAANNVGDGSSLSEVMENLSQTDLDSRDFDDTITLGVFKLRKSIYTPDTITLDYVLAESFVGSLDYHRTVADQTGGPAKPFYIGELADKSTNIKIAVNPWISNRYSNTWINNQGKPGKKVRFLSTQLQTPFAVPGFTDNYTSFITRVGAPSGQVASFGASLGVTEGLYSLGSYSNTVVTDKSIGALPRKLERAVELIENSDIYPVNIAVEGGLGTVYVNSLQNTNRNGTFDFLSAGAFIDSAPLPGLSALYTTSTDGLNEVGTNIRSNYTAVANALLTMAERRRKDFIVILDPLRNIFVQGANTKVINTKKLFSPNAGVGSDPSAPGFVTTNFSQHIYWPLRHQFGAINSSYAAIYANFAQVVEGSSNRQVWVPFSGFAAASMAATDQNFNPWSAPAGFTRGIVVGANDLGVYPRQNQRDQLYKISLNPVTFFPGEGFVIFGQKTALKKPSAFDRLNVRRLFLALEVAVKNTMKFYVFEPNTLFTRTQVINTLAPIFENAKNTEGIYDYLIVCDERNNTPDVIDNNELKVDIYIKPVRTAEFILVSFYATRTGQNFQELVGG